MLPKGVAAAAKSRKENGIGFRDGSSGVYGNQISEITGLFGMLRFSDSIAASKLTRVPGCQRNGGQFTSFAPPVVGQILLRTTSISFKPVLKDFQNASAKRTTQRDGRRDSTPGALASPRLRHEGGSYRVRSRSDHWSCHLSNFSIDHVRADWRGKADWELRVLSILEPKQRQLRESSGSSGEKPSTRLRSLRDPRLPPPYCSH